MTWFLLSCAIVYLAAGLWYVVRHPESVLFALEHRRLMWLTAGVTALAGLLTLWPLILFERKR